MMQIIDRDIADGEELVFEGDVTFKRQVGDHVQITVNGGSAIFNAPVGCGVCITADQDALFHGNLGGQAQVEAGGDIVSGAYVGHDANMKAAGFVHLNEVCRPFKATAGKSAHVRVDKYVEPPQPDLAP